MISIILSDLSLDNLKMQDELETIINGQEPTNSKIFKVKQILKDLVNNELMITKFQNMVSTTNNNNLKQNQNG